MYRIVKAKADASAMRKIQCLFETMHLSSLRNNVQALDQKRKILPINCLIGRIE